MSSINETVSAWLKKFEAALTARNLEAATALFDEDCYWRDLVTFTWNIKTMEGKAQISAMLKATLEEVKPSNWMLESDASGDDGFCESWITFETAVARGHGMESRSDRRRGIGRRCLGMEGG